MSNKRAASIKAPLVGIVRQARGEQLFHRQLHGNGRPVNIRILDRFTYLPPPRITENTRFVSEFGFGEDISWRLICRTSTEFGNPITSPGHPVCSRKHSARPSRCSARRPSS